MISTEKLSVAEAAKLMNTSPMAIRRGIILQRLPIGFASKDDAADRWKFDIYKERVVKYLKGELT